MMERIQARDRFESKLCCPDLVAGAEDRFVDILLVRLKSCTVHELVLVVGHTRETEFVSGVIQHLQQFVHDFPQFLLVLDHFVDDFELLQCQEHHRSFAVINRLVLHLSAEPVPYDFVD